MSLLLPLLLLVAQATTAPAPADPAAAPTPKPLPNGPVVVIDTTFGRIKIGLHRDKAPLSVANFLAYVKAGHYDGTIFHRVIPKFMVQGGGFEPDMTERPTRPPVKNEAKNGLSNRRGTVAMARTSVPDSATSQFFINVGDNLKLDYGIQGAGYCVFGEVLEGMDVVDQIVAVPTTTRGANRDVPETDVLIKRARVFVPRPNPPATKPVEVPAPKP
jgi:cyclophilin family peptidyl-prolyl cis-trans isomerase